MPAIKLLDAVTSDTVGQAFSPRVHWCKIGVTIEGSGSATVEIQELIGDTWFTIDSESHETPGNKEVIELSKAFDSIRAVTSEQSGVTVTVTLMHP